MLTDPSVALAILAQAAPAAPAASQPSPPSVSGPTQPSACGPRSSTSTTIVICGTRPQGYRLDPDVMEAKREMRSGGRPPRQYTETPPPDCRTIGPAPCVNAGIDLLAAAAVAAEMGKRLASGQEIGSMFVTDPQPSEYQLYQMAKARREAAEAQKAAVAARERAAAAQQAANAPPSPAAGPAAN